MQDKELVRLYRDLYFVCKDYIKFLDGEIAKVSPFLHIHGWRCKESVEKEGNRRRQSIKELEDQINNGVLDEIVRISKEQGDYEQKKYTT